MNTWIFSAVYFSSSKYCSIASRRHGRCHGNYIRSHDRVVFRLHCADSHHRRRRSRAHAHAGRQLPFPV